MNKDRIQRVVDGLLMVYAFALPVTIVLSQTPAYLAAVLALAYAGRVRAPIRQAAPFLAGALLFALCAVGSVFWSIRPELTLAKSDRLLLLGLLVAVPWLGQVPGCDPHALARKLVLCFLAGATVQALMDVVSIPWSFAQASAAHDAMVQAGQLSKRALRPTLFDMGNMRDPQFYMVSLSLLIGWALYRRGPALPGWWWVATVLNTAAFVLQFKRGAWLAFLASTVIMALVAGKRKVLGVLVVLVALTLALPAVRERLMLLKDELRLRTGGRYALWTVIAPRMYEDYPTGIGWKAARHEDFTCYQVKIQPKLNHLHNNVLQMRLELGWPGLAVWSAWMLAFLGLMGGNFRRLRSDRLWAGLAYGMLGGYLALHLNGMVEYNFGDSEIYMLFIMLMALALLMRAAHPGERPAPGAATSSPLPPS